MRFDFVCPRFNFGGAKSRRALRIARRLAPQKKHAKRCNLSEAPVKLSDPPRKVERHVSARTGSRTARHTQKKRPPKKHTEKHAYRKRCNLSEPRGTLRPAAQTLRHKYIYKRKTHTSPRAQVATQPATQKKRAPKQHWEKTVYRKKVQSLRAAISQTRGENCARQAHLYRKDTSPRAPHVWPPALRSPFFSLLTASAHAYPGHTWPPSCRTRGGRVCHGGNSPPPA